MKPFFVQMFIQLGLEWKDQFDKLDVGIYVLKYGSALMDKQLTQHNCVTVYYRIEEKRYKKEHLRDHHNIGERNVVHGRKSKYW